MKNFNLKNIITAGFVVFAFIWLPKVADAVGPVIQNPIKANNIQDFVLELLDIVIQIGILVVVFYLILAGLKFVTAQGDTGKLAEARKALFWGVIGALLVLGARTIAQVIQNTAKELQSFDNLALPVVGFIEAKIFQFQKFFKVKDKND